MKTTMKLCAALLLSTALATPALAENAPTGQGWKNSNWMLRARAIHIRPDVSSSITPGAPTLGGHAEFSNETVPELDLSYFFTPNVAVEVIAATAKHKAKLKDSAAGSSLDVGSAWVLPPTVTLQYHFTDFQDFKPYVGAGVNYTIYYKEKPGSQTSLDMDNDFGWALQAGVDVPINDTWGWNFDVKKLFVNADASWNNGGIRGKIDLDPWIIGTGISYRF